MRPWLIALCLVVAAEVAQAADIAASAPTALSVAIYRSPHRNEGGSIELDSLGGFALVTETRTVRLPAGESRLRFEGVVDGIRPASAIVTGLPGGVIEKNRDAAVLLPDSLMRAAIGAQVTLVRTNRKTGKTERIPARLRSASDEGMMFETAQGIEALRCSGFPETFTFSRVPDGLSSTPTLSVLTRTSREITATVTLSYLADSFDWAADYVAKVNPDGRTLDLSAWITLANGNGVSLPNASTQIVAGRLNRVEEDGDMADDQPSVVAQCWPLGTTSDPGGLPVTPPPPPAPLVVATNAPKALAGFTTVMEMVVSRPEQLGDLKLYRLPQPTTVAARQSKQVRLLDLSNILFVRVWSADLEAASSMDPSPTLMLLRTKNDLAHHLGLPLPSGSVAVFSRASGRDMLVGEPPLRDTAVDEEVELKLGESPDVQVKQTELGFAAGAPEITRLTPELLLAHHKGRTIEEVEITNARGEPTPFELRLWPAEGERVEAPDHPMGLKDGRPIFRLTLPANSAVMVRYAVKSE